MANQNYVGPAYNNGYNNGYSVQGMQGANQMGSPLQMPMANRGVTTVAEVSGEEGMNNYPVTAGTTALLIDFSVGMFWLKSRDAYGVPREVRRFNFSELIPQPQSQPVQNLSQQQSMVQNGNGVSREEFDELKSMITSMYKELNE